jgi:hypothetical protein
VLHLGPANFGRFFRTVVKDGEGEAMGASAHMAPACASGSQKLGSFSSYLLVLYVFFLKKTEGMKAYIVLILATIQTLEVIMAKNMCLDMTM